MTNKHTPGPWIIDHDSPVIITTPDLYSAGESIAKASTNADAQLIAAAPDLLEALQAIIEEAGPQYGLDDGPGTINKMARLARSAIAKATGEMK